jgi:hydroxymethylglutaryl-CoA lyase
MIGNVSSVIVRDVGPRDGLQSEAPISAVVRAQLANDLASAGVPHVEVAAFVSPRAVPAMADADQVVHLLERGSATWWALVPNQRGAEMAISAGLRHLTVTVSASPVYSSKNVGMSVAESIEQVRSICALDRAVTVDAVVSCAFGSAFGDAVTVADVAAVCDSLRSTGVAQLTLADTTGTATPRRIEAVLGSTGADVGLHLHDTRATALTNAYAAISLGVTRFDTSVGGLGGSPFAPGAGGNLATEELVLLLHDMGVDTGIDLEALLQIGHRLATTIGRDLPSRTLRAGALPAFGA